MPLTQVIIAFETEKQMDTALAYALSNGCFWLGNVYSSARGNLLMYARTAWKSWKPYALCISERSSLHHADLAYFKTQPYYVGWSFMHASDLDKGVDCTIPE